MVCPAPPGSLYGNRVTAERWRRILESLGHRVRIVSGFRDEPCDLLIALHARRSAPAVFAFRARYPQKPLVVALTGTDLYRDLRRFRTPWRALAAADRIVALQPLATAELEPALHDKVRVIYQSAKPSNGSITRSPKSFDVSVAGHLRTVKDPFRAAYAVRRLPGSSRIRVLHAGRAMTKAMEQKARAEQARNPRYTWLGPLSAQRTRRLIAQSRLMVISSRMEGGANVISEAVVDGVPVLASRIPGSVGLLGKDYIGYFPVGDTEALAELLHRAENDSAFYRRLRQHCAHLKPLFRPQEERERWRKLLSEIAGPHTRK
ncbi:MAG TPA: selenoneine biosynthesis selenosugar synthase SenB [Bryobacteraceae bacterium]|nr:selenoneine biosynthesis selenosugar synthase SenB [Bryobacteraceae bacterium]